MGVLVVPRSFSIIRAPNKKIEISFTINLASERSLVRKGIWHKTAKCSTNAVARKK